MPEGPKSDKVARDVLRRELRAIEVRMDELRGRRDRIIGALARLDAISGRPGPTPREMREEASTGFRRSPERALKFVEGMPSDPQVVTREDAIDRVLIDHMRSRPVSDALKSRLIRLGLSRFMDPGELSNIQSDLSRKHAKRGWVKVGAGRATRWRKATVDDFAGGEFEETATFLDLESGHALSYAEAQARPSPTGTPLPELADAAAAAPPPPDAQPAAQPPAPAVPPSLPSPQPSPWPSPPPLPSEPGFARMERIPALEPHRRTVPRPEPVFRKIGSAPESGAAPESGSAPEISAAPGISAAPEGDPEPEDLSEFFPREDDQ